MIKVTQTNVKNGIQSNSEREKYLCSRKPGKPLPMNFLEKLLIRANNLGIEAAYIGRVLSENPYPRLKQEDLGFLIAQAEFETWKLAFKNANEQIMAGGIDIKEKTRFYQEKNKLGFFQPPKKTCELVAFKK